MLQATAHFVSRPSIFHVVPPVLCGDQRVVTTGCYDGGKAMSISTTGVEECALLSCNADESETRVWLHVLHSSGNKKFLYSSDTDMYHIGLTLIDPSVHNVYVQLSSISSPELGLTSCGCGSSIGDPNIDEDDM